MKPILFAAKRRGLLLLAAAVAILAVAAVAAASSDPPLPPDIDTTQVDQGVFGPGPAGTPIEGTEAEVTVKAVKKAKKDKPDKPGSVTASEADSSAQIIYVCTYGTYAISEAFGIMRAAGYTRNCRNLNTGAPIVVDDYMRACVVETASSGWTEPSCNPHYGYNFYFCYTNCNSAAAGWTCRKGVYYRPRLYGYFQYGVAVSNLAIATGGPLRCD
jgi:hypothetical protein